MTEPNVPLIFRDLCRVDAGNSLSGDEIVKTFDSEPDYSDVVDPFKRVIADAAKNMLNKSPGVADFSWDAPMTAAPVEKCAEPFTNPLKFSKSSIGFKLRVTRIGEQTVNGEKWAHAYSGDDLVDARVVSE
jgi:hypothetical protein